MLQRAFHRGIPEGIAERLKAGGVGAGAAEEQFIGSLGAENKTQDEGGDREEGRAMEGMA